MPQAEHTGRGPCGSIPTIGRVKAIAAAVEVSKPICCIVGVTVKGNIDVEGILSGRVA